MKRIFVIIALLAVIVSPVHITALRAGVTEAVGYLIGQPITDWSAQALVAAGETPSNLSFLQDFNPANATDVEKRILTLAALGEDPETYYASKDLVKYVTQDYYQDNQIGDPTLLNDDFFGVLALASVGKINNNVFSDSVDFITSNQNSDGGWSWALGGDSDTNDTAIAIMALAEAGYSISDSVIAKAFNYLESVKNDDGGWPWAAGGVSDAASTSWVVSALVKFNQSVASDSYSYLESLQTADGSFKWVNSDADGSMSMTAFATIAFSQSYFPVKKLTTANPNPGNYLRIEGDSTTYCEGYFVADTALGIIEAAADTCGYTYEISETSFGLYLSQINTDIASGTAGWMYRVNWEMPSVGPIDYKLNPGDEVLWYFGEWDVVPLKLSVSNEQVGINDRVVATVESYNDSEQRWDPAINVTVNGGDQHKQTDDNGQAAFIFPVEGLYTLKSFRNGYVRSQVQTVQVGAGKSDTVSWQVSIEPDTQPVQPEVSFRIVSSDINFGTLSPGQRGVAKIDIANEGNRSVYLEAIVNGEAALIDQFALDGNLWPNFKRIIPYQVTETVIATLTVPEGYDGSGARSGEVVFWGVVNE